MLNNNGRLRHWWLRIVPGVHLLVDGRQGFSFIDKLLSFGVTGFGGEQRDYCRASRRDVRLQCFPGLREYRALNTSWMMLLLLSDDKPISSEAAASTIQNAG